MLLMTAALSAVGQSLSSVKKVVPMVQAHQDAAKQRKTNGMVTGEKFQVAPFVKRVSQLETGVVAKRAAGEGQKPEALYTACTGYYNLVPDYVLTSDGSGNVTYTDRGILGYIDRDLMFINRTTDYDSFLWDFYGETPAEDTITTHPFFVTDGYVETPKLQATLAGVDSVYQMGAYLDTYGKTVPGMVALVGGGFVYNVDPDAAPFQDTGVQSISGDWSSMMFGYDQGANMAYVEMYEPPYGGPVVLMGTAFYVMTPSTTTLENEKFTIYWHAKQKDSGEWKELSNFSVTPTYMPDMAAPGSGIRVWLVDAYSQENLIMVEDSFSVMIQGPQGNPACQWAMFLYSRSSTEVDEEGNPVREIDPIREKNTAYYLFMDGEKEGLMGQYGGTVESPSGETVGYISANTSLDIHQYIITPYILLANKDMTLNETNEIDLDVNGASLGYYLSDWYGAASDGVSISIEVKETTDGDWLTVSQPVAGAGITMSGYFTFDISAPYLGFDNEGRRATLVVKDNKGFSRELIVYQGDHAAADKALSVEQVNASGKVSAVYAEGAFLLTYPTDYKTVYIYSMSGQLLGKRILSAGGSDRINVSGLQKGIYLLQFVGKDAQAVKVLR